MALSQADKAFIAAAIADGIAASKPVRGTASSRTVTFRTSADIAKGEGFPCAADKPCSRALHTEARAATHGVANGGHEPR